MFDDLTSLRDLFLNNNRLTALPAGVFDSLGALTVLDLRFNFGLTLPKPGDRVLLPLAALTTYNGADYAQPARTDICSRTDEVEKAILAAVPFTVACGQVAEASLAAITSLSLSGQSISALASGDFAGLTGLETLDLSDNDLRGLPEDVFDGLGELETLDLDSNLLTSLSGGVFDSLTSLTWLALNSNDLTELPDGVFNSLAALETLDLRSNASSWPLPESGDRVLLPLLGLTRYNGSPYVQPPRTDICDRTQAVEKAILEAVPFTVACGQAPEAALAGVEALDLSGQSISALLAGDFAGLTGLETLDLSDNDLSGLPETVFDDLGALETLDLRDNDSGWTLPEPGDRVLQYLVSLRTYNGDTYVQPEVPEPPGPENDFPDDATSPGRLSVGRSVTGAIGDPDPVAGADKDAFLVLVTLKPGTTYRVDLEGEAAMQGTLYDPFLEVWTLNPTLVGSDGGPGRNARVEFEAKEPGEYRIRVSSESGSFTGTYRLSLDEKRDPPGAPAGPLAAVLRLVAHRGMDRARKRRQLPRHLLRPAPHPQRQPRCR